MAKTTAPLTPQTAPPQQDLYDDVGSAMMTGATMLSGVPGSGVVGAAGLLLRMQGSMGNQAAQAIAGLRGPGLDALEGYADHQLTGLADACMDVPGLNVAAMVASRQMQDGVEFGVGATRFGVDTLGGLVEMAAHPIDALRGVETMVSHTRTLPWWMQRGAGLGADMLGVLGGDTTVDELVGNLTQDPSTKAAEDNAYWQHAIDSMLEPMSDPWNNGRPWEAAGYATAALASLFIGEEGAFGKVADLTKGGRAFESVGTNAARALPKMDNSLELAATGSKAETGALKAWRSVEDAGVELSDGVARGEGVPTPSNRAIQTEKPRSAPLPDEPNRAPGLESPAAVTRQDVEASIRKAQATLGQDPRLPPLDADGMIAGLRMQGEIAQVGRIAEDLCSQYPRMPWPEAVTRAQEMAPRLPAYMGRGIESYIPGTGVGKSAPRTLHIYDRITPGMVDETIHHEAIHALADPSFGDRRLQPFNEGVTQWLTRKTYPDSFSYPEHVKIIEEIASRIGEDNLVQTFTGGNQLDMSRLLEGAQPGYCPEILRRLREAHASPSAVPTAPTP